jgi:hypothetical protein
LALSFLAVGLDTRCRNPRGFCGFCGVGQNHGLLPGRLFRRSQASLRFQARRLGSRGLFLLRCPQARRFQLSCGLHCCALRCLLRHRLPLRLLALSFSLLGFEC